VVRAARRQRPRPPRSRPHAVATKRKGIPERNRAKGRKDMTSTHTGMDPEIPRTIRTRRGTRNHPRPRNDSRVAPASMRPTSAVMKASTSDGARDPDRGVIDALERRGNRGESEALACLAYLYRFGVGVTKNAKRALAYYRRAAELGDPEAGFCAADMYRSGEGSRKDLRTAVRYFRNAAERGSADALASLGYMHWYGQGLRKDRPAALKLYRSAARLGSADANHNLGQAYRTGAGVPRSASAAFRYFHRAALLGHPHAQYRTALALLDGVGVRPNRRRAQLWMDAAKQAGDPAALDFDWPARERHASK